MTQPGDQLMDSCGFRHFNCEIFWQVLEQNLPTILLEEAAFGRLASKYVFDKHKTFSPELFQTQQNLCGTTLT